VVVVETPFDTHTTLVTEVDVQLEVLLHAPPAMPA